MAVRTGMRAAPLSALGILDAPATASWGDGHGGQTRPPRFRKKFVLSCRQIFLGIGHSICFHPGACAARGCVKKTLRSANTLAAKKDVTTARGRLVPSTCSAPLPPRNKGQQK